MSYEGLTGRWRSMAIIGTEERGYHINAIELDVEASAFAYRAHAHTHSHVRQQSVRAVPLS